MQLLDLSPEVIEQILSYFTRNDLYPVLFTCRAIFEIAIALFRKSVTLRGDPWQLEGALSYDPKTLRTFLEKSRRDRSFLEDIQNVTIRGWKEDLTAAERLPWSQQFLSLTDMCHSFHRDLSDDYENAQSWLISANGLRMMVFLLQFFPNLRYLHVQVPQEESRLRGPVGGLFCGIMLDLTSRKDKPAFVKLEEVLIDCILSETNKSLGMLRGFANCRSLKRATIINYRQSLGFDTDFPTNPYLKKLTIGERVSKIWSAFYESSWEFDVLFGQLNLLLQSLISLKSLEINHNANVYTAGEDYNLVFHPVGYLKAIQNASGTLEELSFVTDSLDCVNWRAKEMTIGSFQAFHKLTTLRIQLHLLTRTPDEMLEKGVTPTSLIGEMLPPSLRFLTLLDCSRWVKRPDEDSSSWSTTFHRWSEAMFMEEMTGLLQGEERYVPFLERLSLGQVSWETAGDSVVDRVQAIASETREGLKVYEDYSHRPGKLERWLSVPLRKEYVTAQGDSSNLSTWAMQ